MSSYWDALTRARLGLPGEVQSRQPSLFEGDSGAPLIDPDDGTIAEGTARASFPDQHPSQQSPHAVALDDSRARPVWPVEARAEVSVHADRPAAPIVPSPPPNDRWSAATENEGGAPAPVAPAVQQQTRIERETRTLVERTEIRAVSPPAGAAEPSAPRPQVDWSRDKALMVLDRPETAERSRAAQPVETSSAPEDERPHGQDGGPATPPAQSSPPPVEPLDLAPLSIEIGRIEIRIVSQSSLSAPSTTRPAGPGPARAPLTLDDYLAKRGGPTP